MKSKKIWSLFRERLFLFVVLTTFYATSLFAQTFGTAFSYQGALREGGAPVNGTRNITFRLFDASSGGAQVGADVAIAGVVVADGLFVVSLDFGAGVFDGNARWLEIEVEGSILTPRQEITPVPYALFAANSGSGAGDNLGNHTATQALDMATFAINNAGAVGAASVSATGAVSAGSLSVTGTVQDSSGDAGTAGQILSSTAAGTDWIPAPVGDNLGNHTATTTLNLNGNVLADTAGSNRVTIQDANGISLNASSGVGVEGLRIVFSATSPNLLGGNSNNAILAGSIGATIAGGGQSGDTNTVTDNFGFVGGGRRNRAGNNDADPANAAQATVAGGLSNEASGVASFVGGGFANTASGFTSTVGGGGDGNDAGGSVGNLASGTGSTVAGGLDNVAGPGNQSTVGGGQGNTASGAGSTVAGGDRNTASGQFAMVGGGGDGNDAETATGNVASGTGSTVAGGQDNMASGNQSTVSGGSGNVANGDLATVGGGSGNMATVGFAAIGGGQDNIAANTAATVGGGQNNTANGVQATVGGGNGNAASNDFATVAGGDGNMASGRGTTVGGGAANTASTFFTTVGGGSGNSASSSGATVGGGVSNMASGSQATVPGGNLNVAGGDWSFAAGFRAIVRDPAASLDSDGDEGSFVWADSTDADFTSTGPNQFRVRASGGVFFVNSLQPTQGGEDTVVIDPVTGELRAGSAAPSSAQLKTDIRSAELDYRKALELEPKTYLYKSGLGGLQLGYIAEELDAMGLAPLVNYDAAGRPAGIRYEWLPLYQNEALKAHEERLAEKDVEIQVLTEALGEKSAEIERLRAENQAQEERLARLEALILGGESNAKR
jgi:hypothetical protein